MKRILFISLAILLCAGMAYALVPTNNSGPGDIMGNGKAVSDAHKIFRLVRYVPTDNTDIADTITKDSIVVWDTISDDGVTVTLSTTSADSSVAGIIVTNILTPELGALGATAAVDVGRRNWGWLQTYGKSQADFATTAIIAVKGAFGPSTERGMAGGWPSAGATNTGLIQGKAGFVLDAVTASLTDVDVFITGLD
jgi:hypothetical protein